MLKSVEITMTMRGFEVRTGGRASRFPTIEAALEFASQRLHWANEIRELSRRCE